MSEYNTFYYDVWNKNIGTLDKSQVRCLTFDSQNEDLLLAMCGSETNLKWDYLIETGQLKSIGGGKCLNGMDRKLKCQAVYPIMHHSTKCSINHGISVGQKVSSKSH